MAVRAEVTSPSTSAPSPRTSIPRNGGTASNTTRTHRGSRSRWPSFTSPSAITISNAPSFQRNQTGVTSALPSFRYVASTAGDGPSSSGRAFSTQSSVTFRRRLLRAKVVELDDSPEVAVGVAELAVVTAPGGRLSRLHDRAARTSRLGQDFVDALLRAYAVGERDAAKAAALGSDVRILREPLPRIQGQRGRTDAE